MHKSVLVLASLLISVSCWAQEVDPTAVTRPLMGPVLMALVGYLSRKRPIGGWLLLFYAGLVVGSVVTLLMAIPSLNELASEGWDRFYWWLAVLGYIPWLLAYGATVLLGFRAAIFKERKTLTHMRAAMVALVVFGWISVFINFQFFSEDGAANFLGAYTAVVSSLWCAYWFLSRRVEHVMTLGNSEWNYEEFKNG